MSSLPPFFSKLFLSLRSQSSLVLVAVVQSLLLVIGIYFLDFSITWFEVFVVIASAVATEFSLARFRGVDVRFPASAIVAALGITLFLRASNPIYFAIAGFAAVASKHLIQSKGGHILNPSNFGILLTVFVFNEAATIEFTQWGDNLFVYLFIATLLLFVVWRTKVYLTTIAFLVSYTAMLLALLSLDPITFSAHHYGILGPSIMLFATLMITDPKTSPQGTFTRVFHGFSVAALYFVLEFMGARYALFVASLGVTILTLLSTFTSNRVPKLKVFLPANTYSTVLVSVFAVMMFTSVSFASERALNVLRINPEFILMGVERGQVLSCSKSPTFLDSTKTVNLLQPNAYTHGAAWGDYDNDGDDDLFISSLNKDSVLYENVRGGGAFKDVTKEVGIGAHSPSSAAFVDYDNDHDLDLFLMGPLTTRKSSPSTHNEQIKNAVHSPEVRAFGVYRNDHGNFVDVTQEIGLQGASMRENDSGTFSFADYDADGDLDFVFAQRGYSVSADPSIEEPALAKSLFDPFFDTVITITCNADDIRTSLAPLVQRGTVEVADQEIFLDSGGCIIRYDSLPLTKHYSPKLKDFTHKPLHMVLHMPGSVHLYENRHGGKFVKTNVLDGILDKRLPHEAIPLQSHDGHYSVSLGRFYQPISFDYDVDGDADIFLAVDFGTNILLENRGELSFIDVTEEKNLDFIGSGMGVTVLDYNRDSLFDFLVTNVRADRLYENTMAGEFKRHDKKFGELGVGWGVTSIDYNLDGWEDLLVANGDIETTTGIPYGSIGKALFRSNLIYKNEQGTFVNATWSEWCPSFLSTYTLATSDYDNDGDIDFFVGNIPTANIQNVHNALYTNTTENKNYLKVNLKGSKSNTYGVGASIHVTDSAGGVQSRLVTLGESFYSQHSLEQLFGFGENNNPVQVRVVWPSGKETTLENVSINQKLIITE